MASVRRHTVLLLMMVVFLQSACKDHVSHQPVTFDGILTEVLQSEDWLAQVAVLSLVTTLACSNYAGAGDQAGQAEAADMGGEAQAAQRRETFLRKLKETTSYTSDWTRLQSVESQILCRADNINSLVIERYRTERDPEIRQQLVEIVAMFANEAIRREISARAIRGKELYTKIMAYNLIQEPFYLDRLHDEDSSRVEDLVQRLKSELNNHPMVASRALRHLMSLGRKGEEASLIKKARSRATKPQQVTHAMATLALAGSKQAVGLFGEVYRGAGARDYKAEDRRYGRLGLIATGIYGLEGLAAATDSGDSEQTYEALTVLLVQGSAKAKKQIVEWIGHEFPHVRHYATSILYASREWPSDVIARGLQLADPADQQLIVAYLKELPKEARLSVYQDALKGASEKELSRIVRLLRRQSLVLGNLEEISELVPEIKAAVDRSGEPDAKHDATLIQLAVEHRNDLAKLVEAADVSTLSLEDLLYVATLRLQDPDSMSTEGLGFEHRDSLLVRVLEAYAGDSSGVSGAKPVEALKDVEEDTPAGEEASEASADSADASDAGTESDFEFEMGETDPSAGDTSGEEAGEGAPVEEGSAEDLVEIGSGE